MSNIFDVGIIGAGVAGAFAAFKIAKDNKNIKTILFDAGRPPLKRRRQLEGFLGCLPNSDGKLYLNDLNNVAGLTNIKKTKAAHTYFNKILSNVNDFTITKDRSPNISAEKKLKKIGYDISLNDFIQIYPRDIHILSKYMSEFIENCKNITYSFDNEVLSILKQKNCFNVTTNLGEFKCKKLIIAVGRSGWRWVKELYSNFGIIDSNEIAKFGIRIEINANMMKEFNKSNCTLTKGDDIEIGPFSWNGTIIPEDHLDLAISAFRSNENRWKTDKVSFSLIGNRPFSNNGFEQTDRIGKLTFILANDRIIKEKISNILTRKSKISIIPEYNWLIDTLTELGSVMPEIISKGYYHVPTIVPLAPKINIGNNLVSEIDGMFITGESAGLHGILSAATTGIIAANEACK